MLTRRQAVFAMTAATLLIGSPPAMAQTRLKVVASFSIDKGVQSLLDNPIGGAFQARRQTRHLIGEGRGDFGGEDLGGHVAPPNRTIAHSYAASTPNCRRARRA